MFEVLLRDGAECGGFKAEWLIAVMTAVSGMNPEFYDHVTGGQGLAGLTPQALRIMQQPVDGFRHLPPEEQLPVILDWFRLWRRKFQIIHWGSRAELFLALYMPPLLPVATLPTAVKRGHIVMTLQDFEDHISRAYDSRY